MYTKCVTLCQGKIVADINPILPTRYAGKVSYGGKQEGQTWAHGFLATAHTKRMTESQKIPG
jgi:hypothetical protein